MVKNVFWFRTKLNTVNFTLTVAFFVLFCLFVLLSFMQLFYLLYPDYQTVGVAISRFHLSLATEHFKFHCLWNWYYIDWSWSPFCNGQLFSRSAICEGLNSKALPKNYREKMIYKKLSQNYFSLVVSTCTWLIIQNLP